MDKITFFKKNITERQQNKKKVVILHSQIDGALAPDQWKDAGVVDRGGLENRCTLAGTQGSNPCLSANTQVKSAVSQQLAADLILYTYKLLDKPSPIQMGQYHRKSKGGKIIL